MVKEVIDLEYRKAVSGDGYGILNIACATAGTKYEVNIPSRYKSVHIQSSGGTAFKIYKTLLIPKR